MNVIYFNIRNKFSLRSFRNLSQLTHIDAKNNTPKMVDVSGKLSSLRIAHARVLFIIQCDYQLYFKSGFWTTGNSRSPH